MTQHRNAPSAVRSPQGRRVLVASLTGPLAETVQAWRQKHDPAQARRLPPHMTLCYWVPDISIEPLGAQVQHALSHPVTVNLDGVHEFDNEEHTFYVGVTGTWDLDRARERLYDGTHVGLGDLPHGWTWHVTCVRDSRDRDRSALREHAARLQMRQPWRISLVELLELQGDIYQRIAAWEV